MRCTSQKKRGMPIRRYGSEPGRLQTSAGGLAAWFGGSLMGAVGLNGSAAVVGQPGQRLRVANAGWARWTPVNLAGGAVLLAGNKGRLATQRGVASATVAKAAVTGLALGPPPTRRLLGNG
jgi:hypothetical protein